MFENIEIKKKDFNKGIYFVEIISGESKTIKKINIGDHLFFVAKVFKFNLKKEKKPLVYFASSYKKLS